MNETTIDDTVLSNKTLTTNSNPSLLRAVSVPATSTSTLAKTPWYQQKFELYRDVIEEKVRDAYPELPQMYKLQPANIECSTMKGYDLDFSNDTVVIQYHPTPAISLVKSSMSRTLIYRTNKEFDKCSELLKNILSVQESRRNAKSSAVGELNRKKQQQLSINTRSKKPNRKAIVTKSSFVKTNINGNKETSEHRPSYSLNKNLHLTNGVTVEEPSFLKNRVSSSESHKHITHSPSPTQNIHQRLTSPLKTSSLTNNKSQNSLRRRTQNKEEFLRSSSCSDIQSLKSNFMHQQQKHCIIDQFITYLTRIRTISKQIRVRNSNHANDPECYHLWNELENSVSSALSYANDNIQFQLSLISLRREIIELRKQLQTTNVHLHEYDLTRRNDEQYVHLQKKFDTNQIQCTQLLLHNKELKTQCQLLQNKIDHLEQDNIRLIQRLTLKDLHSIVQCSQWISTNNDLLLDKEIIFLKEKLYHVYDDLATLLNQNHTLQISIREQDQQLLLYKQQINNLKQSAQKFLHNLDDQSIKEKIKQFLNHILIDQHYNEVSKNSLHLTPTKSISSAVKPSSILFEIPHKIATTSPSQPVTFRSHISPIVTINKHRPKLIFVTPTVLNDSNIVSKFQYKRNPTIDVTHCSSSTIDDADSILISSVSTSLSYEQRNHTTLYNSLPILSIPTTIDITKMTTTIGKQQIYNNESSPELDQISDLTSKIFSSGDEEDSLIGDNNISTSSSLTITSDAEKLMHI
ncbi:unnamed protein product [Rotaria sordida]|uniref:Uncharacterized protein n=1 Tax=Rotaria sordida TaxID=392033 RepID=A0A819ECP2_9BILA|nr:unnamed protein product [Rotaria sordida]